MIARITPRQLRGEIELDVQAHTLYELKLLFEYQDSGNCSLEHLLLNKRS